jgi:hypothetical protein
VGEEMKHVTVDVNDARLNPGERLPVTVYLTIRRADSGTVVVERDAPAMYAPGHGYHFGDNFLLENDNAYSWTVTVSPVQALRQAGAQDVWREPVTWEGEFRLDADGNVIDKPAGVQIIGDVSQSGLHVTLGHQDAVPLYDVSENGDAIPQEIAPDSRYFVVDVTDHAVNYEEKLPGATVTLTFRCAGETFDVQAAPVISPLYGFHYGANVPLTPGEWQITVTVEALDFWRHAGAAVSLGREPVSATFDFAVAE